MYNAINPNSDIIDLKFINLRLLTNATVWAIILVFIILTKILHIDSKSGAELGRRILSINLVHAVHFIFSITL